MPQLTLQTALQTWQLDPVSTVLTVGIAAGYLRLARGSSVGLRSRATFVGGTLLWWLAANSFIAAYADTLFWMYTLQFVILLMVVGFMLAAGRPVTVLASHRAARRRLLHMGRRPLARYLLSPVVTAVLMLVTPWLLFLTPWYRATINNDALAGGTQVLLVAIGVVYFYARLQVDPVPRHRYAGLSLLIATAETLGDGILGVLLWQGSVLSEVTLQATARGWGPTARTDQTIGAGVLWVLGDVLGLPFLIYLFTRWRSDDERAADRLDVEEPESDRPWFLDDPELSDRFRRQ